MGENEPGDILRGEADSPSSNSEYEAVVDFYDAANPSTDAERALVIGYWKQKVEGQDEISSQGINNELKNLGYGVSNITRAMSDLIQRNPSLVRQVSKSGSSQQATKTYKLTQSGIRTVEEMISGDPDSEE